MLSPPLSPAKNLPQQSSPLQLRTSNMAVSPRPRAVSMSNEERRRSVVVTTSAQTGTGDANGRAHSKPQRMQRAASHRPFSVALDNHPTEVDQDVISSRSFRSAKTSTSSKSRKSVRSNSSGRATSKVKSDDGAGKPNGSQASIIDNASSGGASASGSSSSKSGRTETPGRVNSTVTSKQQRMLIDAVNVGQPRKSTVASTRDPLDYTDDEFIMSDARDEPFEDDFEIDFQMLKVDQAVAPPRAAANTNSQSMYIPPSAQELIIGLKHSLDNVEKARRKMEQRYLEEMHKRIALEDELARLRRCITLGSIPLSNNNS